MTYLRIAVALVGFLGAIWFPWYVPAICIFLLALRFRAWEAIALGALMDLLWFSPGSLLHGLPIFTVGAIIVVWMFEPLRSELLA